ncbi:MAG: hypothetical protein ACD_49C00060G0046 [uncultured bacterium (gcode 4)]|uniref:Uncharacterized protein n=1 Tax=uncultured bacterium (gcode 4) TaxID=1234023 RepID=K2BVG3_9BACT|nr:MAG: hypothetical protein ACD_49C00060G0046 [uncultured bacterium (gcode 4)]
MKNSKLIVVFLIILLSFWWFVYLKSSKKSTSVKQDITKQNDYVVSNPQDEINFNTKEVNPDDYKTLGEFLSKIKTWTWMNINLMTEDFVILTKKWTWSIETASMFRQEFIKNDPILGKKEAKNEAILDVFNAYKSKSIYRTWDSQKPWSKISFWEELRHPSTNMINAIFTMQLNMYDLMKDFLKRPRLSIYDAELLSYLYDLNWDYAKANASRESNCKTFPQTCSKNIDVIFKWKVTDGDSKPIAWAKIELLNISWNTIETNSAWEYEIKFKAYPFSHLRFKASMLGYSDWFISSSLNMYYLANSYIEIRDFTLNKANKTETISKDSAKDWYYIFKTTQSTYKVPVNWLYYLNDKKFEWNKLTVYLYEFNKWSKIDNLMNVDTFNPVYGYVGNIMKTFWMPYIQFFDENENEVFVKKSNPIILTNQIYHMKELYENYDKIYEPITKEDMKKLVEVSKQKWGYPIDFKYLTENNMLRWPAWWVLDRRKWTWDNIWSKVINEDWLVELPFYSIKD